VKISHLDVTSSLVLCGHVLLLMAVLQLYLTLHHYHTTDTIISAHTLQLFQSHEPKSFNHS